MEVGFYDVDAPTKPARVLLEQVSDTRFALLHGFTYRSPDGSTHHVLSWHLPCTDLASIPRAFRWFEGRHGRHTLAALLHDHQVAVGTDDPGAPRYWRRRTFADDRFAESMGVLGVPLPRRALMWSAVHFRTRLGTHGPGARLAMVAWLLFAVVGMYLVAAWGVGALFGWQMPLADPSLALGAALGPVAGALLWVPWTQLARYADMGWWRVLLRRWACGLVMGYGVLLMLPMASAVGIAEGIRNLADLGGWGPDPWGRGGDCD